MDVESLKTYLILQDMTDEQQETILSSVRAANEKAKQLKKERISQNVGLVVDALKKIEADIRARYDDLGGKIEARVNAIRDGRDGADGRDGKDGRNGRDGKDGAPGPMGPAGRDGRDGLDGQDGVSVIDAKIDFDGSLVISLSNGREINVGEVVAPDLAERIKVITNGGGTSQTVIDTLASLQTQIDNLIPSQTGNAGKFLTTDGSTLSWADIVGGLDYQGTWNAATNTPTLASGTGTNGFYYVVSVDGSTNLDGITDWKAGDWAIFNGTTWQKIDQSWATAGINSNITGLTDITNSISSPTYIQMGSGASTTLAAGRMWYDQTTGSWNMGMGGGNITQQVGEELFVYGKASATITDSPLQIVYQTGTVGASGVITFAPTVSGITNGALILGVATEPIANNGFGRITAFGIVHGITTNGTAYGETWADGDIIWYNPVTGNPTNVKPVAPNIKVQLGTVIKAGSGGSGTFSVEVQHGSTLGGTDSNVELTSVANNNLLQYDSAAGYWKNVAPSAVTGVGSAVTVTNGVYTTGSYADPSWITSLAASKLTGAVAIANGGTGQTTQTAGFDALSPLTTKGDLVAHNGTNGVRLPVGTNGQLLTADSTVAAGVKWAAAPVSTTVADDTTTNATYYPTFATATSGTFSTATVSSTKLVYNPSLGDLRATQLAASNGILFTNQTVSTSVTFPTGYEGISGKNTTVASGVTVTVPSGANWTIV